MSHPLFLQIVNEVGQYDPYFIQSTDAIGVLGLSSLQKITAAYRILAYGTSADSVDEYIRIGESTTIESLRRFVKAVIAMFGDHYLRSPNNIDIARLLQTGEQRGFPGMLGSIDCMHWKWKNCPTTWQCMYTGHCHEPTIILEAVASQDLWIWHAFFGLPGSLNDINVLNRSPVFTLLANGHCHTPIPVRPDWRIRIESGARDYILGLSLTYSYIRAELVPVGIQLISVITKIIYIYKRTTTGVVSIKIYTHILSPIYLYKHLYLYMSNKKHQRLRKQCGEHLSLSWPALLMWDVLSSILVFFFCTYTD